MHTRCGSLASCCATSWLACRTLQGGCWYKGMSHGKHRYITERQAWQNSCQVVGDSETYAACGVLCSLGEAQCPSGIFPHEQWLPVANPQG